MFLSLIISGPMCVSLALDSGSRCVSLAGLLPYRKRAKGWAGPTAVNRCLPDSKNCHHKVLWGENTEEAAAERPGLREPGQTSSAV